MGLFLALASACGGGASDGAGAIPIERFEIELAEAYCAAADRCDVGAHPWIWSARQADDCGKSLGRLLAGEGRFAQLRAAVASGEATYEPNAARACIDSFKGLCPPCTEMDPEEWCPEAFEGGCYEPPKARWQAPVVAGGACGVEALCCEAGSWCVGDESRACQPRVPEGSRCAAAECAEGLACSEDAATGLGGTCRTILEIQELVDAFSADRPVGASCYKPGDVFRQGLCNPGLVCHLDTMTCGAPKEKGARCQFSGECAGVCETDGSGFGQCAELAAEGCDPSTSAPPSMMCLAEMRQDIDQRIDQPTIGDPCEEVMRNGMVLSGSPACAVSLADGVADTRLFCHSDLNVCVLDCTTDADCPAAWVCDLRATVADKEGNMHFHCVNPARGTFGCGGGEEGGGMAAAVGTQAAPSLGMPCTVECMTGGICERQGIFVGQCTAGCGSGAACQLLAPGSECFGTPPAQQCGLTCALDLDCPMGTTCQQIGGMRGCRVAL